jgi:hypothetical protein
MSPKPGGNILNISDRCPVFTLNYLDHLTLILAAPASSSSSSFHPVPPLLHLILFLLFILPCLSSSSSSHPLLPLSHPLLFSSFPSCTSPSPFPSSSLSPPSFLLPPFFPCVIYSDYDPNSIHKINKNLRRLRRLQ